MPLLLPESLIDQATTTTHSRETERYVLPEREEDALDALLALATLSFKFTDALCGQCSPLLSFK